MPEKVIVSLSTDVLGIDGVWSALLWVQHFDTYRQPNEDDQQLRARLSKLKEVTIFAAGYNSDHHYGPVITVKRTRDGEDQSLEIVVPWHKVLAVVIDKTGNFQPGFAQEPS